MSGSWWSQPFAPEGSAAAEGIVKQLGKPALDPLTILVREAAQNSWDARGTGQIVDFRVEVAKLGARGETWKRILHPEADAAEGLPLAAMLDEDSHVLVISDRGTVGLGGPLRAGHRERPGEKADFVQFLRNVGEPSDHRFGGGTYGFGKGIFYRLSRAGSILVDSRSAGDEPSSRRLMGAALGHSWYRGDQRFTGRHWWGRIADDGIPDPLIGEEAEEAAAVLGMPGFRAGETGTDIVVLAADLGSNDDGEPRSAREAAEMLASSIMWHLWPKFMPDAQGRFMRFWCGTSEALNQLPSPTDIDELRDFAAALENVRRGEGFPYTRTVAPRNAGMVSHRLTANSDRPFDPLLDAARPFEGPLHHLARMRLAELVVDYFPGPSHPDPLFGYAGVFRTTPESDAAFATAEPPTHDDWVIKGLSGSDKGVVQGIRPFLSRYLDEATGLGAVTAGTTSTGLSAMATRLGALVNVVGAASSVRRGGGESSSPIGDGGAPSNPAGGRSSSGRRSRGGSARLVGRPRLALQDGIPFLSAEVVVPASPTPRSLRAEVAVVLDGGGAESESPAGAIVPTVTHWARADGGARVDGDRLRIEPGDETRWQIFANHVPDAMIRFRLLEEPADAR